MAPLLNPLLNPVTNPVTNPNMTAEQEKSASRTKVIATSVCLGLAILAAVLYLITSILKRREARKNVEVELSDQAVPDHGVPMEIPPAQAEKAKDGKYNASGGYEETPDQMEGLLSGAQNPASVAWDTASVDVGDVQRPRSVASFTSVPPRYDEYRPQAGM